MREQLLGYLLGALDPAEQAAVEARLAEDPQMRRELDQLRANMAPLDDSDEDEENELDPPPDLGTRTFRFVRNHANWSAVGQGSFGQGPASNWRAPDYIIAAGIFLAATMLVFPAVHRSRVDARVAVCQNHLRVVGVGLSQYAIIFRYFPYVPPSGRFAACGIFAPILQQHGLIPDASVLICPDSTMAENRAFRIPSLDDLRLADTETLQQLHRFMAGSYGYHPGHIENNRYVPTRLAARDSFVMLADAVDELGSDGTANHGHRGQNVLCQSGRVVFLIKPRLLDNGDNIYVSDYGARGAGRGENDCSVSSSPISPIALPVTVDR
ncbi:MAG TPA: hypothetical protein VGJ26_16460 [Pirellulales bacterium]|jgi:hypothetical protein